MGLKHRQRTRKRVTKHAKHPLVVPIGRNVSWSMDFMHDSLMNKRRFRVLNIIDDFNRQALVVDGDYSYPGDAIIRKLERAVHEYGKPQSIRVDKGPELTCSTFVDWCEQMDINIRYIQL